MNGWFPEYLSYNLKNHKSKCFENNGKAPCIEIIITKRRKNFQNTDIFFFELRFPQCKLRKRSTKRLKNIDLLIKNLRSLLILEFRF